MTKRELNETELDALFEAAQRSVPEPSAAFMARLEQDALRGLGDQPPRAVPPGWFTRFRQSIGGWGGFGGLVAATVTGFWIGVAAPDSLGNLALFDSGGESYSELLGGWSDTELFGLEDG